LIEYNGSGPLLTIVQWMLPWQPVLRPNWLTRHTGILKGTENRIVDGRVNSAVTLCKNFVNFAPVTPEIALLIWVRMRKQIGKIWHIPTSYLRMYWTDLSSPNF